MGFWCPDFIIECILRLMTIYNICISYEHTSVAYLLFCGYLGMKLSEKQKIQLQLRQYLKSYRNDRDLSAEEAAKDLGIEIATYRNLEGKKTTNRLMSSLEYIVKIASLKDLNLMEFISYLTRNRRTESGSNLMKRSLYSWETKLLDLFDKVGISDRENFIKLVEENQNLKQQIKLILQLNELKPEVREKLITFISSL